jgi:hypothetical protein
VISGREAAKIGREAALKAPAADLNSTSVAPRHFCAGALPIEWFSLSVGSERGLGHSIVGPSRVRLCPASQRYRGAGSAAIALRYHLIPATVKVHSWGDPQSASAI